MYKSGFVAVIGRPNVGKSTLLNSLLGQKIVIVSDKPQTTRNKIHCVLHTPEAQVVFLDTPGIHRPQHKLGQQMVRAATNAFREVDLILFMVESTVPPGPGDRYILKLLKKINTPVFLIINKTDIPAEGRELNIRGYQALYSFKDVWEISALQGTNLAELAERIVSLLPTGPEYYPEDMITDQPERFVVAELVREKILLLTREEIPHSVAVVVEEMHKREQGEIVDIRAVIYIERESQKGIVIGKGGRVLKEVGSLARQEIENLLGSQVFLDLWVKVKKDWRNKESFLKEFGYKV